MVIAWKKLLACSIYGDLGHIPEKAMAPHSSTLAWKIPWTEEPGGLQSMGLQRVGHDLAIKQQRDTQSLDTDTGSN